jgi:hypothetical protein
MDDSVHTCLWEMCQQHTEKITSDCITGIRVLFVPVEGIYRCNDIHDMKTNEKWE